MKQTPANQINASFFCPGPPNRDPRDFEKRWRVYTSIAMMARHGWHVADRRLKKKLRVQTASDANWLRVTGG